MGHGPAFPLSGLVMGYWCSDGRLWLSALAAGPCRDCVVAVIGSFMGCDVTGRWVLGYGCGMVRARVSSLCGPNRGCVFMGWARLRLLALVKAGR